MCLIIHKPKGETIEKWIIDSAKEYNPDGIGIMSGGKVCRSMKIKTAKVYDKINSLDNAAIHFRMATHGTTDIKNCHPFKLNGDTFLMHNGIMSKYNPPKDSNDSDTATFVKEYCNPDIAINGKLNLRFFEEAIRGQAIALMHKRGRITRHGSGWNTYAGCIFSNQYAWDSPNSWKPTKEYSYLEYTGVNDSLGYRSCDDMIDDFLYSKVYDLPLENEDYIDKRDIQLFDQYWSTKIDEAQFIDDCSPETKINLFSYLIEKELV